MAELQDAVIVSAVRTAIGTYGGGLADVPAVKLGEICIRAALERADLKPFLDKHYVTVLVDVGRFDTNLQIPAHYGITERLEGVPALLVVDPTTDRLLDPGRVSALEDARHMTPQGLADWLAQWTP